MFTAESDLMTGKRFKDDRTPDDRTPATDIRDGQRLRRIIEYNFENHPRDEVPQRTIDYLWHMADERDDRQAVRILTDLARIGVEVCIELMLTEPDHISTGVAL